MLWITKMTTSSWSFNEFIPNRQVDPLDHLSHDIRGRCCLHNRQIRVYSIDIMGEKMLNHWIFIANTLNGSNDHKTIRFDSNNRSMSIINKSSSLAIMGVMDTGHIPIDLQSYLQAIEITEYFSLEYLFDCKTKHL